MTTARQSFQSIPIPYPIPIPDGGVSGSGTGPGSNHPIRYLAMSGLIPVALYFSQV